MICRIHKYPLPQAAAWVIRNGWPGHLIVSVWRVFWGEIAWTVAEKKLTVIEIQNGMFHVKHLGQNSMVDSRPIWVEGSRNLLYARGEENGAWEDEGSHCRYLTRRYEMVF